MNSAVKILEQHGTLLYHEVELPLDDLEWKKLEAIVSEVEHEHIVGGDVGESHSVHVCRFYNDAIKPEAMHPRSAEIHGIVMSEKMRAFYKNFTGTEKLCLRRCQSNRLRAGDYIGKHKDQDSNPDYLATVVFHLGSAETGGVFVTHDKTSGEHSYTPERRMALVNNCFIPHEVTRVEKGERCTLACFLSANFGPSRNTRREFTIAK